jgi:hypothetical protein
MLSIFSTELTRRTSFCAFNTSYVLRSEAITTFEFFRFLLDKKMFALSSGITTKVFVVDNEIFYNHY